MSQSKVQHIFRVFDALNVVKGIKAVGGPDHQTYYIESDVYAPDRRITPLILQPYVEVSDPNGVIPAGDKIGELSSASWFVGEAILANKVTDKESEATMDTPFAIGENNALHVRKNSTKSILLIFEGEYLDIRKDKNIHISLTYTLTTTSNTEVKPAPKLMLSKPQSWKYCPLENQTKAVIEATVSQDSKLYQSAVQWVKVEGDKETLIGEDDPFYLEGQNTDKLTINPSLMGSTLIRAKNHDEVFYNEIYGINPEWDHRMDEVMRNRNFYTSKKLLEEQKCISGNLSGFTIVDPSYKLTKPISVKKGDVIYKYGDFGASACALTDESAENFIFGFRLNSGDYYKVEEDCFFTMNVRIYNINNPLVMRVNSDYKLYVPAPEDLIYRNLVKNGEVEFELTSFVNSNRPFYINKEGLYYVRCSIIKGGVLYLRFQSKTYHGLGESTTHSDIYKAISNPEIERCGYYGNATIANNICINLTSKFGIGNEPPKEVCDEIFENYGYIPSPEELSEDGIIKGTYQSDIKFTRYFPKLESEIDFLTGDTLRAGMDTVKMKAVFKTNKEEIKNPEQYFDIKWYLDPVEAGGSVEFLGEGEYLDVPISKIPLKARAIPFRLEYEFK